MALFSNAGIQLLLRWTHFLSGITWIGLLYYFNFVQGPFFAESDASTKSVATQKLVPRALWWFRWSAAVTFLSGMLILGLRRGRWSDPWGPTSPTGGPTTEENPPETPSNRFGKIPMHQTEASWTDLANGEHDRGRRVLHAHTIGSNTCRRRRR